LLCPGYNKLAKEASEGKLSEGVKGLSFQNLLNCPKSEDKLKSVAARNFCMQHGRIRINFRAATGGEEN